MNKAPEFSEFHDAYGRAYGRKLDRLAAERAWRRLSARDKRAAIAGIQTYADDCRQRGIAMKYPSGYLNLHRWEIEEVSEPQAQPATFEHPRPSGSALSQGTSGTKREQPVEGQLFAQPLPSHPRGGAGVGPQSEPDNDPAAPLKGMDTW